MVGVNTGHHEDQTGHRPQPHHADCISREGSLASRLGRLGGQASSDTHLPGIPMFQQAARRGHLRLQLLGEVYVCGELLQRHLLT